MDRRSFLSLLGIAPAALVLPRDVVVPLIAAQPEALPERSDAAWIRCARLGFALHRNLDSLAVVLRCDVEERDGSWVLHVTSIARDIVFDSHVSLEEATSAVKVMLACEHGSYAPVYVSGRVLGVSKVSL